MKRNKKFVLLLVGILSVGAIACAGHRARGPHNAEQAQSFISGRVDALLDDIDANEEQRMKVHAVKEGLFVEFKVAHAGADEAKATLLKEWKSEKPNAKKLHSLADQRVAAYQKALHEALDGMIDVHEALNAEQRSQVAELMEKRMKKH